jgi:hypothetical protein
MLVVIETRLDPEDCLAIVFRISAKVAAEVLAAIVVS